MRRCRLDFLMPAQGKGASAQLLPGLFLSQPLKGDTFGCMENAKGDADVVRAYLAAMRLAIQDRTIYPRNSDRYILDAVTFGLLSKAFSLADAVAVLVENQHPEEGFGLVRTLVECTLNLRYLTRDPAQYEARALRFARFYFTEAGYWLHQMLEYFKEDPQMMAKLEENAQEQKITADKKLPGHWSGEKDFTLWRVAIEEHPFDGALFTLRHRQADFEAGYFRTSPYVHGSHDAIDGFYPDANAVFVPQLQSKGAGREAHLACQMTVRYLHQAVRYPLLAAQVLNMDAINEHFNEAMRAFDR
jgi:hypothetical protein